MPTAAGWPPAGQSTLLGSWAALARCSPGARIVVTNSAVAAVFPGWAPLNNALLLGPPTDHVAAAALAELADTYAAAGVDAWALWLPTAESTLERRVDVALSDALKWDTSTLVMTRTLPEGLAEHPGVVRTTVQAAADVGDEPIPASELPAPDEAGDVAGWALVHDGLAVTGAWTYRHALDVGIYAVGTAPDWRRRGLAAALTRHVCADAYRAGARTASLQSTAMGQRLYESLGFVAVGRYDEWLPLPSGRRPLAAAGARESGS